MAGIQVALELDSRRFKQNIRDAEQQVQKFSNKVKSSAADAGKSLDNVNKSILNIKSALLAVATGSVASSIVSITSKFEDLRTTLGSVYGDVAKGAQAFQAIQDLSTKTQFGIDELGSTFVKLASSGIQPTASLLKTFTDAAAVTTDQIGSLNAITDLFARTTAGGLGLEDLNRLADRGIPVFDILQQKLGLARTEITKFGQSAQGAQVITQALAEGINERFGGATENRLKNLSTLMSNFGIAIQNSLGTIGTSAAPAFAGIITQATDFINANQDMAAAVGQTLGAALNGVQYLFGLMADNMELVKGAGGALLGVLGARGLAAAATAAAGAFKALTLAMATNPIGLMITAVAALIGYLSVENGLGRTFAQVGAIVDYVGNIFQRFTTYLSEKVGSVVQAVKNKFVSFIEVLIKAYNKVAEFVPGMKKIEVSAIDVIGGMQQMAKDGLEYAAGKAIDLKTALANAIPAGTTSEVNGLTQAWKDAGKAYDESQKRIKQSAAGSVNVPSVTAGGIIGPEIQGRKTNVQAINQEVAALQAKFAEEKRNLDQINEQYKRRLANIGLGEREAEVSGANLEFETSRKKSILEIDNKISALRDQMKGKDEKITVNLQQQVTELQNQRSVLEGMSNMAGDLAGKYYDAGQAIEYGRFKLEQQNTALQGAADIRRQIAEMDMSEAQRRLSALDAVINKENAARIAAEQSKLKPGEVLTQERIKQIQDDISTAYRDQRTAISELNSVLEKRNMLEFARTQEQSRAEEEISSKYALINLTATDIEQKKNQIQQQKELNILQEINRRNAALPIGKSISQQEQSAIRAEFEKTAQQQTANAEQMYEASRSFATGWKQAFNEYVASATDAASQAKTIFNKVTSTMEDAIVNLVTTGKLNFKDLANSIIADFVRIQARKLIMGVFGGGGGDIFSAIMGKASGGPVTGNVPYLVGERGPELFVPRSAGNIVPNHAMGGEASMTNVTYNINATDAASFRQLLARDPEFIYAVTEKGRSSIPGGRR